VRLKDLNLAPPGGYRYKQPESGFTLTGLTFHELLKAVAQHRANMNYTTEGRLADEIEDAICRGLSQEDQTQYCRNGLRMPTGVHFNEVVRFLKTAASWFVNGRQLVPQEEAERRAAICEKCPYNVQLTGCAPCKVVVKELRESLLRRSTSRDPVLRACGVCGCDNQTQVHVPLEDLRAGKKDLVFPPWCWQTANTTHPGDK
jgi:hypothetical protein